LKNFFFLGYMVDHERAKGDGFYGLSVCDLFIIIGGNYPVNNTQPELLHTDAHCIMLVKSQG
jgi:hypothetical protein